MVSKTHYKIKNSSSGFACSEPYLETDMGGRKAVNLAGSFLLLVQAHMIKNIILSLLVVMSFNISEAKCVPIYDQNPTQEQIDAYNHGAGVGVSGGYAVSRQIGCVPEGKGSNWGFLWYLGAVGLMVYIGNRK